MTMGSPCREVTFGVNFRFSRSSWWQATTWYRRTWGMRPCLSQSLICNGKSEGSCWSQEPSPSLSLSLSCPPWTPPRLSLPRPWEVGVRVGVCSGQRLCSQEGESGPDSRSASIWGVRVEGNLGFLWSSTLQHVARTPSPVRCYLKSFLVDTGKHCICSPSRRDAQARFKPFRWARSWCFSICESKCKQNEP